MSDEILAAEEVAQSVPLLKSRLPYYLVQKDEELSSLIAELSKTSAAIAIDAERASGFRYGQSAYLVQLAIKGRGIYLVDPVAQYSKEIWDEFISGVSSKPWIVHAASQDIPCLAEIGIKPTSILDTELGSRILGLPRVSLGTITEHYLELKLAKEHSAVDWSERPLRQEWLDYAALDVDVLHELWLAVEEDLVKAKKISIAHQEFQFIIDQTPKPVKTERWRSLTGLHELKDARSLTIARAMWEARENLAIEKDIAPGRLIPDLSIVAAVKALPKTKPELASLKSFSGKASRTFIDTWWTAYTYGSTTKNLAELKQKTIGLPNHRNWPAKFPSAHARLMASKAAISKLSEELKIPAENILSPDTLRSICFEPPEEITVDSIRAFLKVKQARDWQIEALAPLLINTLQAVSGELTDGSLSSQD
jgi:ribonuclease D